VTSPVTTVAELVCLRSDDDHLGLLFESRRWTWREVVAQAELRAELLLALRQDGPFHVGVLLENTPEYLFLLAGAALAGAVVVGINPTRRGGELASDIRRTDCQLVVTDSTQLALVDQLDLGLGPERLLVADSASYQERLAAVAVEGPGLPRPQPTPDKLYLLIFTSGSTGWPKAVRMTHGRAAQAAARIPFTGDDVLYSAMPLFHGNALSAAVLPAFATGATLALRRRFSASSFLPDVRQCGATFFNTVGRAIAHIMATPATEHDRDHRLRYVLGPETSAQDKGAFTERFGVPLVEGYGSSENAIVMQPVPAARPGALGRARDADDVVVVDPATGEERALAAFDANGRLINPAMCIGELVGRRARSNFEGYYNNPEADAERTRNGWYWSGDLAYRDGEGIFYFAGRSGDWLRVDSENFAAAPVERILSRHQGVSAVAVYPVPDSRTGDQVMAALELEPGATLDPAAFTAFLASQNDLGSKWAPRYVRVTGALPVTATDKINKKPLRDQGWETPDPVWHRVDRSDAFVPLTRPDIDRLLEEFEANGRSALLGSGSGRPPRADQRSENPPSPREAMS
jgi:fatty-acyl-CoA synthase